MPTHPFLSDAWIEAARSIFEEYRGEADAGLERAGTAVRLNQVITDVPFGAGTIEAHVDTSSGLIELEMGLLDDAQVTVTVDYELAKAVFVGADMQAAMQAFMAGRIRVDGDLSVLLAAMAQQADPAPVGGERVREAHRRLRQITV